MSNFLSDIIRRISSMFSPQNISFFLHNEKLSQNSNIEIERWKDYLYLKKKFGSYLTTLPTFQSTGEIVKKIWWCWLQGENQSPEMCKMCLYSLRKQFPEYEIIVLTEENFLEYVSLSETILMKYKSGILSKTHFSDILRTALLVQHGGVWIDSCVYCSGYNVPIFDYPLFVFQDWKFDREQAIVASNWFISAEKGNPILRTMLLLLEEYWNRYDKIINYFLYHIFFHMAVDRYPDLWKKVPRFSNIPPHILQFELFDKFDETRFNQIIQMSDFHKLTWKDKRIESDYSGTYYEYLIDKFRLCQNKKEIL